MTYRMVALTGPRGLQTYTMLQRCLHKALRLVCIKVEGSHKGRHMSSRCHQKHTDCTAQTCVCREGFITQTTETPLFNILWAYSYIVVHVDSVRLSNP